jgi:hypothetical protein
MLKRVPVSSDEGLCGPALELCSCPTAGWTKTREQSCRSGLQAAIAAARIAAWRPLLRDSGVLACDRAGTPNASRLEACSPRQPETFFSIHRWSQRPRPKRPRSDKDRSRNSVVTGKRASAGRNEVEFKGRLHPPCRPPSARGKTDFEVKSQTPKSKASVKKQLDASRP